MSLSFSCAENRSYEVGGRVITDTDDICVDCRKLLL